MQNQCMLLLSKKKLSRSSKIYCKNLPAYCDCEEIARSCHRDSGCHFGVVLVDACAGYSDRPTQEKHGIVAS